MALSLGQRGVEPCREFAAALQFLPESSPTGDGDPVKSCAAIVLQPLQRGIKRALIHFQNPPGYLLNAKADPLVQRRQR